MNVALGELSTMRLGGSALYVLEIHSRVELQQALAWTGAQAMPVIMIGDGSNIVWRDEGFNGLVLVNAIQRYEDFDEDGVNHYITIGAGEHWDDVVARTVAASLTGIEALSLIPGRAGAAPIQNLGAYGQEISQTLVSIEAYDTASQSFVTIPAADCAFGYRTSRFKRADKGRYYITALTLHLTKGSPVPPYYAALDKYFAEHHQTTITPQVVRDAVIDTRTHKLPDPKLVANSGSFFHNPIVGQSQLAQITANYDDVPHWAEGDKAKLSAAWLIEQADFKDLHDPETGMATWPTQALVLVNEHAKTTADLLRFKQKIVDAVQAKFDIKLEQEPELLP